MRTIGQKPLSNKRLSFRTIYFYSHKTVDDHGFEGFPMLIQHLYLPVIFQAIRGACFDKNRLLLLYGIAWQKSGASCQAARYLKKTQQSANLLCRLKPRSVALRLWKGAGKVLRRFGLLQLAGNILEGMSSIGDVTDTRSLNFHFMASFCFVVTSTKCRKEG